MLVKELSSVSVYLSLCNLDAVLDGRMGIAIDREQSVERILKWENMWAAMMKELRLVDSREYLTGSSREPRSDKM